MCEQRHLAPTESFEAHRGECQPSETSRKPLRCPRVFFLSGRQVHRLMIADQKAHSNLEMLQGTESGEVKTASWSRHVGVVLPVIKCELEIAQRSCMQLQRL
jgi:hypothetical protein